MTEPDEPTAPLLTAELWYESVPDLSDPALLDALRRVSQAAEAQDGSLLVPHTDVVMDLEQGRLPLLTAVFAGSELDHTAKTLPNVGQTWDWEEAEERLRSCTGSVLVTEMLATQFTPQQRVHGLTAVVKALVEHTSPAAVSWPQSQRVTDPASVQTGELSGVVNVRFFTVDDDPGAMVMDTLGLHIFELPDVQCHYRDFDPAQVAAMLFSAAAYVFDAGDVIDDGHTISGPRGDEHFVCQHEQSLLAPARMVLDVDLGPPHAAGHRDRTAC
jgi:hypothetical protein